VTILDLIGRDTTLRKVAGTRGGEYTGPCPWCGGRDRFWVWPHAERPGYWCRQCGKQGDAIQYLRDHDGLSFREACERIGRPLDEPRHGRPTRPVEPPRLSLAPGQAWQAIARAFSEGCERALWSSAEAGALAYLHQRGLQDETIRAARVGYHAAEMWENPEAWGLDTGHKKIWLPPGIVFPWVLGDGLWRIVIRQVGLDVPKHRKYVTVSGGSNTLYRADTLHPNTPAMLVEGVLDALAIAQEASDLITGVAAGSTTGGRLERWIGRLALASIVLVAFDADAAGEQAAAWWLMVLGTKAKRWRPYWDDPSAMLQDGADLRTWIREGLGGASKWWREIACWPPELRELWEERAAILEVEGGFSRNEAERLASVLADGDDHRPGRGDTHWPF
jgi:DNA primase